MQVASMKAYYFIAQGIIQEILIDRVNFTIWRLRTFISVLTIYFLWAAVLPENTTIGGYSQSVMLTYIFGGSIIASTVFSSRSYALGDTINTGDLSNNLIRPINVLLASFASDIGDKAMNVLFAIAELSILIFLLHPPLFFQTNFLYIGLSLVAIAIAVLLYFFFGVLISCIAFWSSEIWAPRFLFVSIVTFFSGVFFPLDILPHNIYMILQLLPFSYLLYFPLKIYLGDIAISEVVQGLLIESMWVIILFFIVKYIWKKGLIEYTAQGK